MELPPSEKPSKQVPDTIMCVLDHGHLNGSRQSQGLAEYLRLLVNTFTVLLENNDIAPPDAGDAGTDAIGTAPSTTTRDDCRGGDNDVAGAGTAGAGAAAAGAAAAVRGTASLGASILSRHRAAAAAAETAAAKAVANEPPVRTEIVLAYELDGAPHKDDDAELEAAGPNRGGGDDDDDDDDDAVLTILKPMLQAAGMGHDVVPHSSMHPVFKAPEIVILRLRQST